MSNPRTIVIDGRAYVWADLVRQRREQLAAIRRAEQHTLFELREDRRPESACTAAGRYLAPSLFDAAPQACST